MSGACPFCDRRIFEEQLIVETTGFYAKASLGQIVEGYTVIFPKRHVACLGDLTIPEIIELTLLKKKLTEAIVAVYQQRPILFEHGIKGQTVAHAHAHLLPLPATVYLPSFFNRVRIDFPDYSRIASLVDLREFHRREGPYLFHESSLGSMLCFRTSEHSVRSGYLREVFAEVVGHPERADWRSVDPEVDAQIWRCTRDKIKDYLESVGIPVRRL